jgi:hypothetical protein
MEFRCDYATHKTSHLQLRNTVTDLNQNSCTSSIFNTHFIPSRMCVVTNEEALFTDLGILELSEPFRRAFY